ncbi:carboxylesterase/lipase family protein [Shewanella acanthi]|uniref:carboxylesterase/lipase family protein n=1 Tax=Shewanella acanthi TaxID=2864212 RepID=UPI001C659FC1|nr:carboxylesterase family protein [Shewanella acanthi]QYJ77431.1 carboxylesterase family protein [Shewanella acanthi]
MKVNFNKKAIAAALVLTSLIGCDNSNNENTQQEIKFTPNSTVQKTFNGSYQGALSEDGVLSWLGIAYAEQPVDALRWKKTKPLLSWEGVREATSFGEKCLQKNTVNGKVIGNESCLFLNIWRPDNTDESLPVMVFLHGGGNLNGSGEDFIGDQLSKATNSVVISINYRLGPMGFLTLPALKDGDKLTDSGNFGTLDAIEALNWVQANIASFGGDKNNITLAGQSAGARNVLALILSPLSKGLIHKAFAMSGGMTIADSSEGQAFAEKFVSDLLVKHKFVSDESEAAQYMQNPENVVHFLRSLPASDLVSQMQDVAIRMAPFPHLFNDGNVLPVDGFHEIAVGNYQQIPLMLGSTKSEFATFAFFDPNLGIYPKLVTGTLFQDTETLRLFSLSKNYGSRIYSGFALENVVDTLANNPKQPAIYGYRFSWSDLGQVTKQPAALLGATHGFDVDFVTGREDSQINASFGGALYTDANKNGRVALVNSIQGYLKNFMLTGNPNGSGLVQWDTANSGSIQLLDADYENAHISNTVEWQEKDVVLTEMEQSLSTSDYSFIKDTILSGRFFMDYWKDSN